MLQRAYTYEDEVDVINNNLITTWQSFGMKEVSTPQYHYYLMDAGLPDQLFNLVCLPHIKTVENITEINQHFIQQRRAFCWWIEEGAISPDLLTHFETDKYSFFGNVPGMILDLSNYKPPSPLTTDRYDMKIITRLIDFEEWIEVLSETYRFSNATKKAYIDHFKQDAGFIHVAGCIDGEIFSTASIFIANGVAGLYNGSTREAFRERGIFTHLYHFMLQILKEKNIQTVVTQTSPMATSLAQKVGFRKVNNYKLYLSS